MLPTAVVSIYIRSEGGDDPGKNQPARGFAYIFVNGKDHSLRSRGHNVVIVDAKTGKNSCALDTILDRLQCDYSNRGHLTKFSTN